MFRLQGLSVNAQTPVSYPRLAGQAVGIFFVERKVLCVKKSLTQ